jgi:glycosyltransferase involved in cell wall biosynthesis
LVEEKQPMLAIKAVERFISEGWSGFFHIVGTGPLSIDIQQYLDNSTYSSKIIFIENPDDARVKRLLIESFVILHPSRREGYGLVLIEAAYAGTASIIINYPENASTELGIHPTLICSDDKIETIVGNLKASYVDQARLRQITEEWVRNASINRTYKESCSAIEHLLKEISSK